MAVRDKPIITARLVNEIDWRGVQWHARRQFSRPDGTPRISALCCSLKDCEDLVHWFGDPDFCPFLPVLLIMRGNTPDGFVYKAIVGDGYATAAELRDCAVVTWERTLEEQARNGGYTVDFDVLREKAGLPERAKAEALIREALWERAKAHKSSPVTDPMRQPVYPNPTNRTVFTHAGLPYKVKETHD